MDGAQQARVEQALAALEGLDKERERRRRTNGIQYYVPNPVQLRFHKSPARTKLFVNGNRGGKSHGGGAELAFHLTRQYPDYYPKNLRFDRPIKAVISATTFKIVERVIEPKIRALLPAHLVKRWKRSSKGYLERIELVDGSSVDVLTLDMDDMAYESADWDVAWLDEPQSQRKWQAIMRGLVDRQGLAFFTFTPLIEPWMKEELFDKADGKYIDAISGSTRDNMFTVDGTPILSEEAISTFEANLPDDVKESRIHGKFFHLRGVVYKEFSAEHVIDFAYEYPDPVICVLDPHDRQPHHVIWAYIDKTDDIFVDYEFQKHMELDDLARMVLAIEKVRGYNVKRRLIDPNFGRKPSKVGNNETVVNELSRHGAYFYESNDDVELGHMLTRDALHFNRSKPLTAVNKPKLFFSRDRTAMTIRSMRNLQYEEWSGTTADKKDPREDERQKETHGADCIRYLLASRPTYSNLRVGDKIHDLETLPY